MKWIKHDTDANLDAKLQNVMLDYGLEGYGLYWYCIELIAGNVTKENITFELEHDARIIARNTGNTAQKVEEMMRYFVRIGLFENSGGTISCMKIAKRLDKSMTSNPEMRAIIEQLKNHDEVMTKSIGSHDKVMKEETRPDETRLDETSKTNTSVSQANTDPLEEATQTVFEYWRKTMGKDSRAKLTTKRKRKIEARLKEGFTVDDICLAINNCASSAFHMGQNDTGAVHDDLELICRNDGKLQFFMKLQNKKPANEATKAGYYDELKNEVYEQ